MAIGSNKSIKHFEILVVDDNPSDVNLIKEAFKEANMPNTISSVSDGVEAMAFLRREGEYTHVKKPNLIILDLNIPKKTGLEVLKEIKKNGVLQLIPVIVLTTSANDDITACYKTYANCCITKPMEFDGYVTLVKKIQGFWLESVIYPPDESNT